MAPHSSYVPPQGDYVAPHSSYAPPQGEDHKVQAQAMRSAGASWSEIAEKFGKSVSTVRGWVK